MTVAPVALATRTRRRAVREGRVSATRSGPGARAQAASAPAGRTGMSWRVSAVGGAPGPESVAIGDFTVFGTRGKGRRKPWFRFRKNTGGVEACNTSRHVIHRGSPSMDRVGPSGTGRRGSTWFQAWTTARNGLRRVAGSARREEPEPASRVTGPQSPFTWTPHEHRAHCGKSGERLSGRPNGGYAAVSLTGQVNAMSPRCAYGNSIGRPFARTTLTFCGYRWRDRTSLLRRKISRRAHRTPHLYA